MLTRYPGAVWRPLGEQTEPGIVPRILLFHTAVGYLKSTEAMFRSRGYTGTESHFGVGGPWDGPDLDGVVWQWQALDRQADAQNAGNAYATSIETMDGGDSERAWSAKQLDALVALGVWWCRQTGNPARLVTSPAGNGFGYHAQFKDWAPDGRSCPGATRIAQLRKTVIPEVAAALTSGGHAPGPTEDDMPLTQDDLNKITHAVWEAAWPLTNTPAGPTETAAIRLYRASHPEYVVGAIADAVVAKLPPAASGGLTEASVRAAVAAVLTEGTARA